MTTLQQDTPETLSLLSDEEFHVIIDKAVRGELDDATVELLKDPLVLDRATLVLISMKKSVEGQLAAKRADFARNTSRIKQRDRLEHMEEQYRHWRAGALRFKSGVEQWMIQLRQARLKAMPESMSTQLTDERNKYLIAYEHLRKLVIEHRDHHCGPECDDECIADVHLWGAIS